MASESTQRRARFDPTQVFSGKNYEFRFDKSYAHQAGAVVFQMDAEGALDRIGIRIDGGQAAYFRNDGEVIEYASPDSEGVIDTPPGSAARYDCNKIRQTVLRWGLSSVAAACIEAACDSVNCKQFNSCGGETQTDIDNRQRALCLNGVLMCTNCEE